ncbi:DDE-type integrase/transposase/recombinase [uncultured Metabacillus sp.]|uniref:DDE-type integrase/transposase/recombinase n=1 Tax=uncultured Metabacillus sp. TaxID=2860135 RepID=UPI00261EB53A|nr:DDE-type integrase/transposase/recombinase [uncultured Metabacillus sp.]
MDEKLRNDIAIYRFGLIAEIVTREIPKGEQAQKLRNIAANEHLNPYGEKQKVGLRTLERYLQLYRNGGFEALKPSKRGGYAPRAITKDLLDKAIQLKTERPERSVQQIIRIMELAKIVNPGTISESTLSKQLRKAGITRKKLQQKPNGKQFRRFEFPYRNACWQGDVQHTLYLPDPKDSNKKRVAKLFAFIDDYSRFIVHGQFYFDEKGAQLEDCLFKAILSNGKPEQIYVDNGAIYRAKALETTCAKLGIKLTHSTPRRPQGRGKIERFFQFVDSSFKPEAYDLIESGRIQSIEQLNRYFHIWKESIYHERKHGETKQTPRQRWEECEQPSVSISIYDLKNAFYWEDERKVDKTGCISFQGNKYEVDSQLVGESITIRFDPNDLEKLEVWLNGKQFENAIPLNLSRPKHEKAASEESNHTNKESGLNFLELSAPSHEIKQKEKRGKLSYQSLMEEEK